MGVGVFSAVVMQFGGTWSPGWKEAMDSLLWHHRMYITLGASLIPTLLSALWWRNTPQEYKDRVDDFFKKIETPVQFENEVGESEDGIQMKRVGGLAMVVALILLCLIFFTEDASGVWTIFGIAGFIGTIALTLFLIGTVKHKREMVDRSVQWTAV
jgi:hypothetical protein